MELILMESVWHCKIATFHMKYFFYSPDYNKSLQPFSVDKPILHGQGNLIGGEPFKSGRVGD